MLSINTNLSSLMVQQNLTKSTNALNTAIERLTTGYKINHAADNAANYSIARNMDSQISAYEVAADNIAMGTDMISTAMDSISLLQNRAERLMDLWNQAQNGTYGEQSIKAIQSEVNAIVDEINRIYENTEYNGIKLLGYDLPDWAQGVKESAGNINSAEAHHIDDATVETYTHVEGLSDFSSASTFAITTVEDLANLATLVNAGKDSSGKTFVMGADLDLTSWCAEHMDENGVGGWDTIGDYAGYSDNKTFKGTFDGNGHVISGLKINKQTSNQGLFGCISDTSTIKNVGIEGCDVKGFYKIGGLVGWSYGGTIESCYSTGDVSGTGDSVGGLVGFSERGTIESCYSMCEVSGGVNSCQVGGLVGWSDGGTIESCYSTGDVSGHSDVGGLAGYSCGTIESCYSTGDVSGGNRVGGLVGQSSDTIESCYSTGNVSGDSEVGGLIGEAWFASYDIELTDVASLGKVSGNSIVGTLIGSACYEYDGDEGGSLTITNSISSIQMEIGFIGGATFDDCDGQGSVINPDYDMSSWLSEIKGVQTQATLQVGIYGDSSSRISTNTHLSDTIRINDISQTSAYDTIQGFLDKLSARSTELGAVYNRLQSAGESTTTAMENLTSSRSTIKDADVAKESSNYIKSQILQQASATLLATANQTPAIALQLL